MQIRVLLASLTTALSLTFAANAPVYAQETAQVGSEARQQLEEINQLLTRHPEIIGSVLESLNQYAQQQSERTDKLVEHHDWMFNKPNSHPYIGAEKPDLQVAVFTDFDCPYCKRLDPLLYRLVDKFPNIRVNNLILPIKNSTVRGSSYNSGELGLNVWKTQPEKYQGVSTALFANRSAHTKESLQEIIADNDVNTPVMISPNIAQILSKNYRVFRDLGFQGTPTLVIGDTLIPGFVGLDQLEAVVEHELSKL